jgi:hypothetical protein
VRVDTEIERSQKDPAAIPEEEEGRSPLRTRPGGGVALPGSSPVVGHKDRGSSRAGCLLPVAERETQGPRAPGHCLLCRDEPHGAEENCRKMLRESWEECRRACELSAARERPGSMDHAGGARVPGRDSCQGAGDHLDHRTSGELGTDGLLHGHPKDTRSGWSLGRSTTNA